MMEPGSNTEIDLASLRCRLLNVVFSDKFATHLEYLGRRNEGDAGQDKVFWHDVAEDFNDYNIDSYGALVFTLSTEAEIYRRKKIDPSKPWSTPKTWKELRDIYLIIQRDYK
jgi:hypothetical protein